MLTAYLARPEGMQPIRKQASHFIRPEGHTTHNHSKMSITLSVLVTKQETYVIIGSPQKKDYGLLSHFVMMYKNFVSGEQ